MVILFYSNGWVCHIAVGGFVTNCMYKGRGINITDLFQVNEQLFIGCATQAMYRNKK